MATESRFKTNSVTANTRITSVRNGFSTAMPKYSLGSPIVEEISTPKLQESLSCAFQDGTRDFSVKSSPILSKKRKQSCNLEMKPQGASRNHYTQVRAHLLRKMGGSDWGSEVSDDVTMTDTFSMDSVYTVEKVVAFYNADIYTGELVGFFNRMNFMVTNYESLRKHNAPILRQTSPIKPMFKVFPFGGAPSFGRNSSIIGKYENSLGNISGWVLTIIPLICLIVTASSRALTFHFWSIYIAITQLIYDVIMLGIDIKNVRTFLACKLCVPVPVTNEHLKGLRNYFKDFTPEAFKKLKVIKNSDKELILGEIESRLITGTHHEKQPKIRVMFYSVEYYQKFIQVPRYKLLGMLFFHLFCVAISLTLIYRKLK